jgi:putative ABC transport system permease protein
MSWWRRLRDRDRLERELSSELADHVERHVADLVALGIEEPEARRRAQLAVGGVEQVKEACRDARGTRWLEDFASDLRYAWRGLLQRPTFAAVAVLSLALGIGANTALFSIIDSLIRRSLPVREPERLVLLEGSWTNPIWEQIRERQHELFDGAVAWSGADFDLAAGGEEKRVNGLFVSGSFFEVFGVAARLGRTILPSDDRWHAGTEGLVAVLSDGFWKRHYGSDPGVVGRTLHLNRAAFTIVGVAPPGFLGPEVGEPFDVAVPIATSSAVQPPLDALEDRNYWWLEVVARRKPGQTVADATDALRAVQAPIRAATLPPRQTAERLAEYLREPFEMTPAAAGSSALRDRYRRPLFTILAVAILVLLVACANVANLQLARGNERRHEFRLRLALGASRWRIARQLLTESILIAGLGATLGLAFALWGSRLLVRNLSSSGTITLGLPVDAGVLVFTGAVAILTALLFGTLPAWRAGRSDPEGAWKEPARGAAGRGVGASRTLIVVQVAISLVLLVAAGLFLRTLSAITHRDLGFRREGVLVVSLYAWQSEVTMDRFVPLAERIRAAVAELPGVASAGLSDVTPVSGSSWREEFELPGAGRGRERAFVHMVTRGWLSVYGTPRLAGRDILDSDRAESPPVALINRAFARKFFGEKDPLGQTIRSTGIYLAPMEVVGVVEDAVYRNVREDHEPTIYVPFPQGMKAVTAPQASLSVRVTDAGGPPSRLTSAVVAAIARIDPRVTLRLRTLSDQIDATLVRERLVAMLSGFFGALALLLAAIGLYGVTSHAVARRRGEIAVRMALGADARRVVRLMLERVAILVLAGVLAGAAVAAWASRFVAALLYGLEPGDPSTILAAASLLVAISLIAAYLPARRAARIDPARVLRES